MTESALLTLAEAAQELRVSPKTVRRLVAAGLVRGTFVGRQCRVRQTDLDTYLGSAMAERPQSLRDVY